MIRSSLAFIIYTVTTLAVFIFSGVAHVDNALAIAFFTQYTIGFIAYITRRYYKQKLENGNENKN